MPMYLPLAFLKSITHDFSEGQQLGRGGFGVVYKGILQNGTTIAVKKLSEMLVDDDRFNNEVTYLIGAKHRNIVQLLGYCAESHMEATQVSGKYVMAEIRHRLICFEYVKNKSLDEYISAEHCGLDWHMRFSTIREICEGLHYLHKECGIVHLDLKPQNILLGDYMVPKIADFGMSRLFGQQESRLITENLRGTLGYMAPEYLNKGLISTKSDIFSLGVIIIELLTGSRDYPQNSEASFAHFVENVLEKWSNRFSKTPVVYISNTFEYELPLERYIQQINACTVIGLRCVDPDPEKRPAAWDIIKMLDATGGGSPGHAITLCDSSKLIMPACYVECSYKSVSSFRVRHQHRIRLQHGSAFVSLASSVLPHKTVNVRDHYRIGKKLGRGQCSTTYRCVRKADGAEYACRSIPKCSLWSNEGVNREIQIMHHLSDHLNVVRIHGTFEDGLFVHIVMELCAGGDLLDRIVSKPQGRYSERSAAQLVKKIIGAVDGCHSLGVIHGNLKPENLLFASNAEDATLKLIGFEFSDFYMPGDECSQDIGITYYVAPEVLQECYGPEADIWSVGVILYILLSGFPPFWAGTEEGTSHEILKGKLDFESDPWPSISDSAKDMVRNMLTRDPKKRFSAHEVLCHPWIMDDAVAPAMPTDSAVLSRLKHYSAMNMFTKMARKVIVEIMPVEEIGGLHELYKMFDTDNSGTITFDELKDGLTKLGSVLSDNEIQTLMDAADIDSNGTIDCTEFVAATLHMNTLEREENLASAFSCFDRDGNGYITTDELSQACHEFGIHVAHLEDMIKDVEQNNEGRINFAEFVAMMKTRKRDTGKP